MITCLAIGATIIASVLGLLVIGSALTLFEEVRKGKKGDIQALWIFLFMIFIASPALGLAVWLWQKALAS